MAIFQLSLGFPIAKDGTSNPIHLNWSEVWQAASRSVIPFENLPQSAPLVELEQTTLVGLTPEGRTTIKLLQLNSDERLAERQRLETP